MRELKFRAWDKTWQKMNYGVYIISPNDNFILEQFTGLLDKNGKEIYEGDIIREWVMGEPKHYCNNHPVEWGFHSDHSSYMYQLGWNLWEDEEYEVIGNIHENKELLDGQAVE